ncbi:GTPase RsgA [Weissella confusa]|uniref:GTPase RsgA n=1 Tax=Weissella confusa TaxID=1583 RepID=A0A923SNR5_WEICO|nr:GTPase RsgA [Weissella confusa]
MLSDKLSVVMGQTGAGKSTLLNHIAPELDLATGEVSQALSRGRHTTRANVDQAIVVTAVKMPDWSSNLLDRQLVALEEKDIEPVIYFTKTDLLNEQEMAEMVTVADGYRQAG